ncbi:MAG: YkgJ family cysteine cluster protein [Tepidisphaerales bacterium]
MPSLPVLQPWYRDGLAFTCTQCGNCCTGGPGYVWLSPEELARLAGHLGLSEEETKRRYCRRVGGKLSLKEHRTEGGLYDCVFLTTERRTLPDGTERTVRGCAIYAVRPLQCRTWPFWDGLLSSPQAWQRASRRCPGMGRGRHYSLEQIEALRTATDWPADAPTSQPSPPEGTAAP